MRDVDLLLLLAAQGEDDVLEEPVLLVLVELGLIAVLGAVASPEEEGHGAALLAVRLRRGSLLDEGPHGGDARAERHHQQGRLVRVRHRDSRRVDAAVHPQALGAGLHLAQPAGRQAHAVPAALGGPLVLDDAQVALVVAAESRGGGDGVQARLDVRHVVQQVANAGLRTGELLEELGVGVALVHVILVLGLALLGAQTLQLLLLGGVGGAELQHLVEAALRPASNVEHLREEGAGRDHLGQGNGAVGVNGLQAQDLMPLDAERRQANVDLLLFAGRPNAEGVTLTVGEVAAGEVELKVIDVALISSRHR
mmetsp:Transcript_6294/g.20223  ORF Transcript_6294/g.20223 Transcript_6294/m.20223 type:complete len:310 (-) Transcript_6294:4460-5389(-)